MISVVQRAAEMVMNCSGLLVTAGAGMGVDSGLPDFRGNEGLWRAYPALGRAQMSFSEIANPTAFVESPRLAWGFYGHRMSMYRHTRPHDGFRIVQAVGANLPNGLHVCTSNVDGQFQISGVDEDDVCEIHGSIYHLQCTRPCSDVLWKADALSLEIDEARCELLSDLPQCPRCGALARPNILMFGDYGWISDRSDSQHLRFNRWRKAAQNILIIEIGAGTTIPSIRNLGDRSGCPLIRINVREAQVRGTDHLGVAAPALAFLQDLEAELVERDFFGPNDS